MAGCLGGVLINEIVSPIPWYLDGGRAFSFYLSTSAVDPTPEGPVLLPFDDRQFYNGCLVPSVLSCHFNSLQ